MTKFGPGTWVALRLRLLRVQDCKKKDLPDIFNIICFKPDENLILFFFIPASERDVFTWSW